MDKLIVIAIILLVFLYLRFFFKRLRLLLSLKKAARHSGSKLTVTSPVFWLPTNRGKYSQLMVEKEDAIYAIKVIGLFQKYCDLHFWTPQDYATRKYLLRFQIDQATPLGSKDTRHKRLDTDFEDNLPAASSKRIIPFYLLSPTNSPIHITKNNGNTIVDLLPGSKIDNIIFADREYLFQYIQLSLHERSDKKHEYI